MSYNNGGSSPTGGLMSPLVLALFAAGAFVASNFLSGLPLFLSVPVGGLVGGWLGLYFAGMQPDKISGEGYISQVVMASVVAGGVAWWFGSVWIAIAAGIGLQYVVSMM